MGQRPSEVVTREAGQRLLGKPFPAAIEAIKDQDFAWLSYASYERTPEGRQAKQAEVQSSARAEATASSPATVADCLKETESAFKALSGWRRWQEFPEDGLEKKISHSHLRVEVWSRAQPAEVAVTFGGTVFSNGRDWSANLRWFTPKHSDQYTAIIADFGPAFIREFREMESTKEWAYLRGAKLYSTGHSLGGGLAQEFAYALPIDSEVPRVTQVYAFDPSPVTGYYSVDSTVRDINKRTLSIDRIYERGEILALVRGFMSIVYPVKANEPTIRAVRYDLFPSWNPISGHLIKNLACSLSNVTQDSAASR